jgi:hypothetical protein
MLCLPYAVQCTTDSGAVGGSRPTRSPRSAHAFGEVVVNWCSTDKEADHVH